MKKISAFPAALLWRLHGISPIYAARVTIGLALLCAFPAAAPAADAVTIGLEGYIAPLCLIATSAENGGASATIPMEAGDLQRGGSRQIDFTLTCNTPFSYKLEAQHGALIAVQAGGVPDSFIAAVPYRVAMHIPTDGPTIDDVCPGDSLRIGAVTCPFTNVGDAIATNAEGRVTVTWATPAAPLVVGNYHERLTLTIGASI